MNRIFHGLCISLVFAIVLLSGCTVLDQVTGTPTTSTEGNAMRLPVTEVSFYDPSASPNPTFNRSGFYYDGRILVELELRRNVSFHDVRLCIYDESWNVIDSRALGNVSTGTQVVHVDVNTEETPEWVIVEHPGFANLSLQGGALRNDEDGHVIVDWNDVPGPSLDEAGECR